MRTRLDNYTITAGTRQIATGIADLTVEDIRLIVNESQKVVICSSMQKDHIVSIQNGVITYVESYNKVKEDGTIEVITIPTLVEGDELTIEIDRGAYDNSIDELVSQEELMEYLDELFPEEESNE